MPSSRRRSTTRRPRVAGRHQRNDDATARGAGSPVEEGAGPIAVDGPPDQPLAPEPQPAGPGATTGKVAVEPPAENGAMRSGLTATLVTLVIVLVIATVLAAWFRGEVVQLRESAAASNEALVDVGATAQAAGQVSDALETVFSYDFARLDESEQAARDVITGEFVADFEEQFEQVRELAPDQQAVVTATVRNIAVKVLHDDRAVLFAFLDQQSTRGAGVQQAAAAAGRLIVTAQLVDGRWRIAGVEPR